jgi:hypothetical protein
VFVIDADVDRRRGLAVVDDDALWPIHDPRGALSPGTCAEARLEEVYTTSSRT